MTMFKWVKKFFERYDQKSIAIQYLSESRNHADLERRMKELESKGIYWY